MRIACLKKVSRLILAKPFCKMASRVAMNVKDVWERLETVKTFVTTRRQIDLSKRDIEFLLEYHEKYDGYKEELNRRTAEIDCIKQIIQTMNAGSTGESSLEELVRLALPGATSDVVAKVHQMAVLNKILKLAVRDGIANVKNGNKIPIPRDSNSTPQFYNIVKYSKKKVLLAEKDLESATRLWLWVKKQTTKQPKEKVKEGQEKCQSLHKTQSLGAMSSLAPAPVPSKTPHHSSCGGVSSSVSSNINYQCHLLLNRHQASSSITDPDYKKRINLEDKLTYLLNQLQSYQTQDGQRSSNPTKPASRKCSVALQTEDEDLESAQRKESSSQTSPMPELGSPPDFNRSLDEVFLPNPETLTQKEGVPPICCSCSKTPAKDQSSGKPLDESNADSIHIRSPIKSGGTAGLRKPNRQFSLESQFDKRSEPSTSNNHSHTDTPSGSLSPEEIQELLSMKDLYNNLLEKTSTSTQVEVTSRAVSARSAGFSPPKRPVVRLKNAVTQTEKVIDPENATLEELLAEDVPEQIGQNSYANYASYSRVGSSMKERSVVSPDSIGNILWLVSRKLEVGQWKPLFTELMKKTEEIIVPEEIKECIKEIEEKHIDEVRKAVASLEKWRQTNGGCAMNVLLEALREIRRRDVAQDVQKLISRQSRDHFR